MHTAKENLARRWDLAAATACFSFLFCLDIPRNPVALFIIIVRACQCVVCRHGTRKHDLRNETIVYPYVCPSMLRIPLSSFSFLIITPSVQTTNRRICRTAGVMQGWITSFSTRLFLLLQPACRPLDTAAVEPTSLENYSIICFLLRVSLELGLRYSLSLVVCSSIGRLSCFCSCGFREDSPSSLPAVCWFWLLVLKLCLFACFWEGNWAYSKQCGEGQKLGND